MLDGEDGPGERGEVDAHLLSCAECRRYADEVDRVDRLAQTQTTPAALDLASAFLRGCRVATVSRRPAWSAVLRVVLAMLGLGQLGLATAELISGSSQQHNSPNINSANLTQLAHESSAWNLALAVGFLCVALRPSRTRALIPLVSAFVAGLGVLTAVDLTQDRLIGSRVLSHGVVVLGLLVLLALARLVRPTGQVPDWAGAAPLTGRDVRPSLVPKPHTDPAKQWRGGGPDLKPSAHRNAA